MSQRRIESKPSQHRINEMIRVPQLRVVSAEGEQLGIMSSHEALAAARAAGMDLVEVAPDSKPPVCRIMDYGKFKYQQKKKVTKQIVHRTKLKEIRVRPKTGDHDIQVKLKQAREFLTKKDKVQIAVLFRGRELAHIEEGQKLIENLLAQLEDISKVESPPKHFKKSIVCMVAPK